MTIDERIEALARSVEALTADVHDLRDAVDAMQEARQRADERERKLRRALMIDGGFTP